MLLHYTIFACILLLASSLEDEQPVVTTSLGKVSGLYKSSYGSRTFSAFEGVPYGKPPIGNLRFAEPQLIEPWTGTWNATTLHTCTQLTWHTNEFAGDEDCLYLNVYVPKDILKPDANLDVLVHIHGGAFMLGAPDMAGPEYLMDRDVVYVTMNYRLGIMGFLSTEDDVVSGNNGLKDQALALKWVKNNIKHFGGNPDSVTITGLSAGGASVHFHYFSPQSKGLFHRGIAQSGTALSPWAIQEAPLERAKQLAGYVGCDTSTTKEMIECMRERSAKQLVDNTSKYYKFSLFPLAPFAPVVEKPSDTAFLTDYPYKLLESGKVEDVPIIFSATTEEGILGLFALNGCSLDKLNEQWNEVLPYVLDYNYTVKDSDKSSVADKIKQFYFGKESISDNDVEAYIKLCGDRYFNLDFEKASRMHAKVATSSVYAYLYGYKADSQFVMPGMNSNISYGVSHGEDGFLIYKMSFQGVSLGPAELSESNEIVKELLLNFIVSFAKSGKPEVQDVNWIPVTNTGDFTYLFIHKSDDVKVASKKELAPTKFWQSLPIKEYEKYSSE